MYFIEKYESQLKGLKRLVASEMWDGMIGAMVCLDDAGEEREAPYLPRTGKIYKIAGRACLSQHGHNYFNVLKGKST